MLFRKLVLMALLVAINCMSVVNAQTNENEEYVEQVVVTATKEVKPKHEVAEAITAIYEDELKAIMPSHPAEALNHIAGVHINNLGGEGHMTAIRQPITTAGVYLYLEDGLPIRPTGFFNHNGLYEINLPQSSVIEVTRGPGTALYGSDAIGGIIDSITKASPTSEEVSFSTELGSDQWHRILFSAGTPINKDHAFRVNLNHIKSGWFSRRFRISANFA